MEGIRIGLIVAAGVAALLAAPARELCAKADYVFTNGQVYTVDPLRPWVEAVAIEDRWISFVGSAQDAKAQVGEATQVIDLQGRLLLPGLISIHEHPLSALIVKTGLMLTPTGSADEMLSAVSEYAAAHPRKPAIVSFGGGDVGRVAITREQLDALTPGRPLLMIAAGGRGGWANTRALSLAGVAVSSTNPVAGFARDESGRPTGVLTSSSAAFLTLRKLGVVTAPVVQAMAGELFEMFAELGITAIYEAGVPPGLEGPVFEAVDAIERQRRLPLRIFGSCQVRSPAQIESAYRCLQHAKERYDTNRFRVRTLAVRGDGIVERRTAGLLADYADAPGERGHVVLDDQALGDLIVYAAQNGFDVHVEAFGDRTARAALDVFESVREAGQAETRLVLGHSQLIDRADMGRFAELEVIAASTGLWMKPDPLTLVRLGDQRYRRMYRLQAIASRGARVAFGSDFPATGIGSAGLDPMLQMSVGTRRGDPVGSGRLPPTRESLSLETMIRGYTLDAAYAIRMEDKLGSIREGKLADLVVVDRNPFPGTAKSVRESRVLLTMMNGVIRHDVAYGLGDAELVPRTTQPIADINGCHAEWAAPR